MKMKRNKNLNKNTKRVEEVIKMTRSVKHSIPKPPSREEVLKLGTKIDGPRKRGHGSRQEQILRFMSRNPSLMVDHEFLQEEFKLKHPQQVRQPMSKLVEKNLVEIYVYKEERGRRLVDIYRYTLTPLGVSECVSRGYDVNMKQVKELGIVPNNFKPNK